MSTNKVVLRSIDQIMADYVPTYQPIYPLFMGKSQSYAEEVGKINFKRLEAVGDIRQKHYNPKDTEMRQISVRESSKVFKKYFLANQFTQSALQDRVAVEDVIRQVLDEHQKQMDDLFLLGEGTSASTMVNNGLFWSDDANYTLEGSTEIDTDADPLIDMHSKVIANVQKANKLSGRKLIMFYGSDVLAKFNGVYAASPVPFKQVLSQVLGANYSFAEMPSEVTPSGANGWIIANLDQCKLHYTSPPVLKAQGINEEKMYAWHNFLMGSCMLDVLAKDAIIRQPATFEV